MDQRAPRPESSPRPHSLAWGAAVLLAGFWCLVVLEAFQSRSFSLQSYDKRAETLTQALEEQTTATFRSVDLGLEQIVDLLEDGGRAPVGPDADERLRGSLARRLRTLPDAVGLFVIDRNGRYVASATGAPPDASIADREYFRRHRAESGLGMLISGPLMSRSLGRMVLIGSRRYDRPAGVFGGVVIAQIALEHVNEFYSRLDLGRAGTVSLWTLDRELLARFPSAVVSKGGFPRQPEMQRLIDGGHTRGSYSAISKVDRIERRYTFRLVREFPLMVLVGFSYDDMLWNWRYRTAFHLLLSLALTAAVLFYLSRYRRSLAIIERERARAVESARASALGTMVAGVAHEINNPLMIAHGRALQLTELAETNRIDPARVAGLAAKIVEGCERISDIVRGMRTLGRHGGDDPFAPASLVSIVRNALAVCEQRMPALGIELRVGGVPDVTVRSREGQLSQALLNLINNAVDAVGALPKGGRWIAIDFLPPAAGEATLEIRVTDAGPGIPADIADQVMTPFFTTKPPGRGTGLGLSISLGIVMAHGGELRLDRECAHTRFVIRIPVVAEALAAPTLPRIAA